MTFTLPGYHITDQISESSSSRVYRGYRETDQLPLVFKLLNRDYPTPAELARYQREYDLLRSLDLEGVVKTYGLEKYGNSLVLLVEDFGGQSLRQAAQTRRFTLTEVLRLAIRLTEILGQIHAAHIIHKDVNPTNIVLGPGSPPNPPEGGTIVLTPPSGGSGGPPHIIKLIDFGLASRLSREQPAIKDVMGLEGTLKYISPEQTGRTNRSLDYRTDFYSLGATLYELLTGRTPFVGEDAAELVYAHLARQPLPPADADAAIPQAVSDIILKLLAKNAADRYQSAYGLKADLERCLQDLETSGQVTPFALGGQDYTGQIRLPEKLYGRKAELQALEQTFERARKGARELVVVAGPAGTGKSMLVDALRTRVVTEGGYFISGRYEQSQQSTPYTALTLAFDELVDLLLTEPAERLAQRKTEILEGVGVNGQILIDLIPRLELVLGPQPAVVELGPTEAQNRFQAVLLGFVNALARPEQPLVLFLDNVQWIDPASLKVLLILARDVKPYVLLILAYRDDEVGASHPAREVLAELAQAQALPNGICVGNLSLETVSLLVADALQTDASTIQELTQVVYDKTGGNAFFVAQFLQALAEEELLTFDLQGQRQWSWNLAAIRQKSVTANMASLMTERIGKLPADTQTILKIIACGGDKITLATLAQVCDKPTAALLDDLQQAFNEGLLIRPDEETLRFSHGRVREAAYALLNETERARLHYAMGQILLAQTPEVELEERIFDIAQQFNRAIGLLSSQEERIQVARLNMTAGIRAKNSLAYQAAMQFLRQGLDLLPLDAWTSSLYELALALHTEGCETGYLVEDRREDAELCFAVVVTHAQTSLEKVRVYEAQIIFWERSQQYREALRVGREALQMLGFDMPRKATQMLILKELLLTKALLWNRKVEDLIHLPALTDPHQLAIVRLLNACLPPSYFGDPNYFAIVVLRLLRFSIQHGNSMYAAFAYVVYGLMSVGALGDYAGGYRFGRLALEVMEKFEAWSFKARVYVCFGGFINHWRQPLNESLPYLLEACRSGVETGDFTYAGYGLVHYITVLSATGAPLAAVKAVKVVYEKHKDEIGMLSGVHIIELNEMYYQAFFCLSGEAEDASVIKGEFFDENVVIPKWRKVGDFPVLGSYTTLKMMLCYLSGEFGETIAVAQQGRIYLGSIMGMMSVAQYHFYYTLAMLAYYSAVEARTQRQYLKQIRAGCNKFKKWAQNAPENFEHQYLLVKAEMMRLQNKEVEATLTFYDQAITLAHQNGFIQDEALANELAGKFCLARGKQKLAGLYLRDAHYAYQMWGAGSKVKQLEEQYGSLLALTAIAPAIGKNAATTSPSSSSSGASTLDVAAIIEASQTISGEIVLENLLRRMMTLIIENAGAQRGLLLLEQSGRWLIQARVEVEPEEIELLAAIPLETTPTVETLTVETLHSASARRPVGETTSVVETLHATSLPPLSVSVVQYVIRTGQNVVLDDAAQNERLVGREYLLKKQPKSLLCLPLRNQARVSGILYLENNLSVGAFTPDRLEVLNLLSAQMAVSLDNALLYNQMEELVAARTQQLQTTAQRLQTTAQRLQTVAHLSGQLNAILNLDRLLTELVNQVKEQFDFYHVHIYLVEGHVGPRPLPEAERGEDDLFSPPPGGEPEGGHLAKPEIDRREPTPSSVASSASPISPPNPPEGGTIALTPPSGDRGEPGGLIEGPLLRLAAGYGEAGARMKAEGHYIHLDAAISLVAQAACRCEVIRVDNVRLDPAWLPNPLLPDTQAEMAVPIIAEGRVIGVLDVQSDRVSGLDDGDVDLLRSLANQVAVAITNARLFEQVEQAKQKAEIASRAKSEFLSSMSHELRTPLNGILGYAQILQRHKELDTMQKDGLNIIRQSGEHLLTLINDILDLSKVEAGRLELYLNDFNFLDFLSGLTGLIRIRAQQKGLGFALEEVPPLPTALHADEKRLRQILINLLTNAVKFTDHGHVTLRVGVADSQINLPTFQSSNLPHVYHLRFEVIDTGVGISPDQMERIFLPFEQVGDTQRRAEGTGLGLSITRRLVELMGGRLQVQSQPGLGSTFWFEVELLPAQTAVQTETRSLSDRPIIGYQGRCLKILIADDKIHNRSVLLHLLTPLGFEVLETNNGREAIQLAQEHQPDLIIIDMVMPVMTGVEAVQQLRQLPEFRDTIILGASASVLEEEEQHAILAGCNAFLSKPIEVKQLLHLLEKHLRLRWTYEEPTEAQIEPTSAGELIPPPPAELEAIYDLAQNGRSKLIRERAALWKSQDPAFIPFADRVIDLARQFQDQQIIALIEPYLKEK